MRRLIHGGKFKTHPISPEALQFPAMLSEEERRLLAYLAANLASSTGKIVELGCSLGGSTRALTEGVQRSGLDLDPKDPVVVSYDPFIADLFQVDHSLGGHGIEVGESFQKLFRELLGPNASMVRDVAGEIRDQSWDGRAIDLLLVNALRGWDVNQHVVSQFYTAMAPGRGVIAHLDYIYSFYPWLPISMEYLAQKGYFEFGDLARWGTVVFGVKKALDRDAAAIDFRRDLDLATKERLLIRSSERFEGYARGLMELSRVVLLANADRRDDAVSMLREIGRTYVDDEIVETHLRMVYQHLEMRQPRRKTRVEQPHARKSPWKTLARMLAGRR